MENSATRTSVLEKFPVIEQFVKFALIGVLNTGVDLVILNIETIFTNIKQGFGYAIQQGIAFVVAVTVSYFLNKYWAFQDKSKTQEGRKFSQFLIISIIGGLINVTVATLAVTYLQNPVNHLFHLSLSAQIWVSLGALCGTAIGLIWNFIGYKFIVFKK